MNEVRRAKRDATEFGPLIITLSLIICRINLFGNDSTFIWLSLNIYFKKEESVRVQPVNRTPSSPHVFVQSKSVRD